MKKCLVILMGVMVCLSGVVMAETTPEQIEEIMNGATYLEFTSDEVAAYSSGSFTMATSGHTWNYPDTSDDSRTVLGNCLDDKSGDADDFSVTITGLTPSQDYEVHVVAVGKYDAPDPYDLEWGTSATSLTPVTDLGSGSGKIIIDYGSDRACPTAYEMGIFQADASGQLVFWFGSNGGSGPGRTQLDGIAIGEIIEFCEFDIEDDSDLIGIGDTQQITLVADEDPPADIVWEQISGPTLALDPNENDDFKYSITPQVAGTYVYEFEATWAVGEVMTELYTLYVPDPANNAMVANYDFESFTAAEPNLVDVENGYNGTFVGINDNTEPNAVPGISATSTACDFWGDTHWVLNDPYATDPNYTDLAYGMTIASWIKADTDKITRYGRIVATDTLEYGLTHESCPWIWIDGDNFRPDFVSINDNEWHFYAASVNPAENELFIYLDGYVLKSYKINNDKLFDLADTAQVLIGNRAGLDRAFEGICDNLRIYNYPKTVDELRAMAAEGDLKPVVDAGEDKVIIYNGTPVQLEGELVYYDDKPDPTVLAWSVDSCPANADANDVDFTALSDPETTVTFPNVAGDYVLSLTANDGVIVYDLVTITIELPTCQDVIDAGYNLAADLTNDCEVNLDDFAVMASQWLDCVDPQGDGCDWPYPPAPSE